MLLWKERFTKRKKLKKMGFQSLFSWMLLWKSEEERENGSYLDYSFNPCSLGCCSERVPGRRRPQRFKSSFNPCSLGCCSESRYWFAQRNYSRTFQSLFSWMLLWKSGISGLEGGFKWSFNPCSLGCCSERPHLFKRAPLWNEFQSLFSWMLLWKTISVWFFHKPDKCFNPCSLGCCSERL